MAGFHLGKPRQNGAHAELAGFAAIDAGEQRIGQAIDHLRAIVALDQGGHRLVRPALAEDETTPLPCATWCRENSGEKTTGMILVGTMNIRPSGMATNLPLSRM